MIRQVLSMVDTSGLAMASIVFFVVFFISVLFWVYLPKNKKHYERMKNLPLQ